MPNLKESPAWEKFYQDQLKKSQSSIPAKMRAAKRNWVDSIIVICLKLIGVNTNIPPSIITQINLKNKDHYTTLGPSQVEYTNEKISIKTKFINTYYFLLIYKPEIIEFFKFGLVGISGIFVDLITVTLFKEYLNLDVRLCSVLSFPFAVTSNYLVNSAWTFKGNQKINIISYLKFFSVNIIGLGVRVWSIHLVLMIIPKLGQKFYLPITLFGILIAFFINFISSKFLVFNKKN